MIHIQNKNISKEIETIKKTPREILELKNVITELIIQQRVPIAVNQTEERSIKPKEKSFEITSQKNKKKKVNKKECIKFKGFMKYHQDSQYIIIGIPKEEEKGSESLFREIMAQNFMTLWREKYIHGHEAQRTPNRMVQKFTEKTL